MSAWIAVRQALVLLEAVERTWASELGLDRPQLMAILLISRRPGRSTSDVAFFSGMRRQHAWRAMKTLLKRNLVHAARVSARGSEGWSLTPDGVEFARRLESNLAWYEAAMGAAVELPMVVWSLQRMVESLVNRPSANGWAGGLLVPAELRRSPDWALHLESAVLPEAGPPPKRRRRGVPAGHPNRPTWTQEEIDETAERWRALWRD